MIAMILIGLAAVAVLSWTLGRNYEKDLWIYHYRVLLEDGKAVEWDFKNKKFIDL
jgi:hypothetical protein